MSRKNKVFLCIGILFLVAIIFSSVYINYLNKNLLNLPKGKQIYTVTSPNSKKYNIYYCYREYNSNVKANWINNHEVIINKKVLDINKDKFTNKT